jgi:hypothetical protein
VKAKASRDPSQNEKVKIALCVSLNSEKYD